MRKTRSLLIILAAFAGMTVLTGCMVDMRSTSSGGIWVWENPLIAGTDLKGADAVDADLGWAVGTGGAIVKTTNGGQTESSGFGSTVTKTRTEYSGTTATLEDVSAASTSTVWAVGQSGTILKTSNGGQTWLPQASGTTGALYAVEALGPQKAVAVGYNGRIERTTDGRTWAAATAPPSLTLLDVDFIDANRGWACGEAGRLLRTTDGGATWNAVGNDLPGGGDVLSVSFATPLIGWATVWDGIAGQVWLTENGGTHWVKAHALPMKALDSVVASGTDEAWAVGADGYVWHTASRGATSDTATLASSTLRALAIGGNVVFAVGDGGRAFAWNGGWEERSYRCTSADILAYSPEANWAVGAGGVVLKQDAFVPWSAYSLGTSDLTAIRMIDGANGWIAARDGTITRYVGGSTVMSAIAAAPTGIASTDATSAWMTANAGGKGHVYRTTDGTTWDSVLTTVPLNAVAAQGSVVIVAGDAGNMGRKTDTGWDVHAYPHGKKMRAVVPQSTNVFVAVGDSGTVMRTIDAGYTWTTQTLPTSYALDSVVFSDPMHGLIAGDHGTLFETSDGGVTWTASDSGTTRDLNVVSSSGLGKRVFGDGGTILAAAAAPQRIPLQGADRYATSVAISKGTFAPAGPSAVVVATGQNWPDAVSGASLAGAASGPMLLTRTDYLPTNVGDEIQRLQVDKAYVLGGPTSVSTAVVNAVKAKLKAGGKVYRLAGADRYETSALIASATVDELKARGGGWTPRVFLATGLNWPDALAASPVAANKFEPILLVKPTGVPASVANMATKLGVQSAVALGDTNAVPASVAVQFDGLISGSVGRWAGPNRYATASEIASRAIADQSYPYNRISLATGANFPDALSGGAATGNLNGLLLLTQKDYLSPEAGTFMWTHAVPSEIRFFGDEKAVGARPRGEAVWLYTSGY